ncbi:MAG: 30S ribosome-binding factor RbfA [Anaerolineae bacterium]|jgi:ribosome-binding factor A|nr:30S ribosome-binding factor RbfA [Anaerolineae bacterium]
MSKKYQRRVGDMIRNHLMDLLERKISDPRLQMVTITDVAVTSDTTRADVHFSVLGGAEAQAEAQEGLQSAAGWLRRELGHRLRLRNTPQLVFHYDPSLERGEHIASILDELELGDDVDDGEEYEA